jgi:hypothetical protein
MEEPGIDKHQWVGEWEALQESVRDAPAESLGELDDLVGRIMTAHDLPLAERPGEDLAEHGATRQFAQARQITRQVDAGEDVDLGDVAHAVNTYSDLYAQLIGFGIDGGRPA